jgi:hypothetical protein
MPDSLRVPLGLAAKSGAERVTAMLDAGLTDKQRKALGKELAIVGVLLGIEGVRKHETRFANEVALVAPTAIRAAVEKAVGGQLGEPVKPAGAPVPPELASSAMCKAMGGLRGDQTLYRKALDGGVTVYIAFWPWGSGTQFTIKVGVHAG